MRLDEPVTKSIGFLSFGHWSQSPYSKARSASDTLLQASGAKTSRIELGTGVIDMRYANPELSFAEVV